MDGGGGEAAARRAAQLAKMRAALARSGSALARRRAGAGGGAAGAASTCASSAGAPTQAYGAAEAAAEQEESARPRSPLRPVNAQASEAQRRADAARAGRARKAAADAERLRLRHLEQQRQRAAQEALRKERRRAEQRARECRALPVDVMPLVMRHMPWHDLLAAAATCKSWRDGARITARDGSVGVRCGLTGELARTFAEGGSLEALAAALRDTHGREVARAQAETRALVTKAKTLSRRGQHVQALHHLSRSVARIGSVVPNSRMHYDAKRRLKSVRKHADLQARLHRAKNRLFNGGHDGLDGLGENTAMADGGMGSGEVYE